MFKILHTFYGQIVCQVNILQVSPQLFVGYRFTLFLSFGIKISARTTEQNGDTRIPSTIPQTTDLQ